METLVEEFLKEEKRTRDFLRSKTLELSEKYNLPSPKIDFYSTSITDAIEIIFDEGNVRWVLDPRDDDWALRPRSDLEFISTEIIEFMTKYGDKLQQFLPELKQVLKI